MELKEVEEEKIQREVSSGNSESSSPVGKSSIRVDVLEKTLIRSLKRFLKESVGTLPSSPEKAYSVIKQFSKQYTEPPRRHFKGTRSNWGRSVRIRYFYSVPQDN